MSQGTTYSIPAATVWVEQEIKRSRFITRLSHAPTPQDAQTVISQTRAKYPDARHHCWAYVASPPFDTPSVGMSDDGEPQGTAGKPMLRVLQYQEVGEIVAVVTRYFGGIKLGTGGLTRAYSSSVQLALKELPLKTIVPSHNARITVTYPYENTVRHWCDQHGIPVLQVEYQDQVHLTVAVPISQSHALAPTLQDLTQGIARVSLEDS